LSTLEVAKMNAFCREQIEAVASSTSIMDNSKGTEA
jgi:hypothetical protein